MTEVRRAPMPRALDDIRRRFDDPALVDRRWAQIAAAALDLFESRGYHATTIKDIAAKAGISAGLVYHYVANKQDVLFLVLLDVLDSYGREIPRALAGVDDPLLRVRAAAIAYCRVVGARVDATVLAYRETKALDRERREIIKRRELETNALIAECVRGCIAAGYFHDVDVELVVYRIVMMAHAWALKIWRLKHVTTLDAYVEDSLAFIMRALLTPRGRAHYETALGLRCGGTP